MELILNNDDCVLKFGLTGDMIREGTVGPDGCSQNGCRPTRGKGCPDPNRWLGMRIAICFGT